MARLPIAAATATTCRLAGREYLHFGGCDYLGLAHHPAVKARVTEAVARYGLSASASRETCGNRVVHEELEHELARFLGFPAALILADGAVANIALLQAFEEAAPVAVCDGSAHPTLVDAAASVCPEVRSFFHGSLEDLESLDDEHGGGGSLFLTDGVYPSEARIADVQRLLALPHRENSRPSIVVDDSHGTGVLGATGRGTLEHCGLLDADGRQPDATRIVLTTTLSKAIGCVGGVVAGSETIVRAIRATSRIYQCTTPPPPAICAAALEALRLLKEEDLLARLRKNIENARAVLERCGLPRHDLPLPVFGIRFRGDELEAHEALMEQGILIPRVSYPSSGDGPYLRLAVNAAHTAADFERLESVLDGARQHLR